MQNKVSASLFASTSTYTSHQQIMWPHTVHASLAEESLAGYLERMDVKNV